jgi:PAS domain S-box-containing protein
VKNLALFLTPVMSALAGALFALAGVWCVGHWRRSFGSKTSAAKGGGVGSALGEGTAGFLVDGVFAKEVLGSAPIIVSVLERATMTPRYVSPFAKKVLGYEPTELIAKGPAVYGQIIDPQRKTAWASHFETLDRQADEMIAEILLEATHRDGARRWLLSRDRVFRRDPEGRTELVLCMAMDVTLLMETRQRIIRSRNEAQAANRAKDEFLALISHELNTPLNAVFGGAQLLLSESINADQEEYCEIILEGARNLKVLFHDLLELTQTRVNQAPEAVEKIVLADLLSAMGSRFEVRVQGAGLQWRMEVESEFPPELEGDWSRVESVFNHLLDNAVKFTSEGRITLRVRELARDGDTLWTGWTLEDTGIGIEESVRERIFEPFSQAEEPHHRHYGGQGIGLAIVMRQVSLLGGTIDVTSEPGEGSTFHVRLPFKL